jgi:hypothetical protein
MTVPAVRFSDAYEVWDAHDYYGSLENQSNIKTLIQTNISITDR